jgi:hypothetical protein
VRLHGAISQKVVVLNYGMGKNIVFIRPALLSKGGQSAAVKSSVEISDIKHI